MALKSKSAVVEESLFSPPVGNHGRRGLDVIDQQLVIEVDLHVLAAHGSANAEWLLVRNQLLVHVPQAVKGSGLLAFEVAAVTESGVINLDLETFSGKPLS